MAYFPFFVDLSGRRGLIVGGGRTALGKAKRLVDFGPALTVVAPEIWPELARLPGVTAENRPFEETDVAGDLAFAVAATDDPALNRRVAALCRERRIPVNVVDTPEECSFLFPSLVKRGPLTIGISTAGASPTAAIWLKEKIGDELPENIGEILDWLRDLRTPLREGTDSEAARKRIFQRLFSAAMERGRPLTAAETAAIVEEESGC